MDQLVVKPVGPKRVFHVHVRVEDKADPNWEWVCLTVVTEVAGTDDEVKAEVVAQIRELAVLNKAENMFPNNEITFETYQEQPYNEDALFLVDMTGGTILTRKDLAEYAESLKQQAAAIGDAPLQLNPVPNILL